MLNGQKKENNFRKISNFTLLETLLRSIHDFLGGNSGVLFQRRCHLKLLPPYGTMLMKTEKKLAKIQNWKFHDSLNNFGRDPS